MKAQHILVVDDDMTVEVMLEQSLNADGHRVAVARDDEAFASVKNRQPRLVLADVRTHGASA